MTETVPTADPAFEAAYQAAQKSLGEGGIPIGAALARAGRVVATGHNERVQHGDPIAHGEMSALRAAGRQKSYRDTTLYTTLAPCAMCTGTIIQFKIPRVVVGRPRLSRASSTSFAHAVWRWLSWMIHAVWT